jgi:hypothetical protein
MKMTITLLAVLFATIVNAQGLNLIDGHLNLIEKDKNSTRSFATRVGEEDVVESMTVDANNEISSSKVKKSVSAFLHNTTPLIDNDAINYDIADATEPNREKFDHSAEILPNHNVSEIAVKDPNTDYGRNELWRAGQHRLNAIGWSLIGSGMSFIITIYIAPSAGIVIGGASGIMAIIENVKSAKALKAASRDIDAKINEILISGEITASPPNMKTKTPNKEKQTENSIERREANIEFMGLHVENISIGSSGIYLPSKKDTLTFLVMDIVDEIGINGVIQEKIIEIDYTRDNGSVSTKRMKATNRKLIFLKY